MHLSTNSNLNDTFSIDTFQSFLSWNMHLSMEEFDKQDISAYKFQSFLSWNMHLSQNHRLCLCQNDSVSILFILEYAFKHCSNTLFIYPSTKFQSFLSWNMHLSNILYHPKIDFHTVSILFILEYAFKQYCQFLKLILLVGFNPFYLGICI